MARLRLTIQVTRDDDGAGIRLDQLGAVLSETNQFLMMLAEDVQLEEDIQPWIATGGRTGSYIENLEYQGRPDQDRIQNYNAAVLNVVSRRAADAYAGRQVRPATVRQFAKIGEKIGPNQKVRFGVYEPRKKRPSWAESTGADLINILAEIPAKVTFHGSLQGRVGTWFMRADPPYFILHPLDTGDRIKCFYKTQCHPEVSQLTINPEMAVIVSGVVTANRDTRQIEEVSVERMRGVEPLSDEEFHSLFGAAPDVTGDETTEAFVRRIRGDEE